MKRPYKTNINIFTATLGIIGLASISSPAFADNTNNINFSAELQSSTTVTIPTDPIEIDLKPSGSGNFGSADLNVVVSTNQPGYTLTMNVSSTDLTSTTINPSTNNYFTIPTLVYSADGYTRDNFVRNRWGRAIDGGTFNSVLNTENLKDTSVPANADNTKITIGTNLDLQTASGDYATTIEFIVVPKFIDPANPTIKELTYLQDFNNLSATELTAVKNSMDSNTAYELQDNRDGTTYHISKLADGNIWLLDNLALDLTNSTVLNNMTPENTNASTTSLTSLKSGNRSAGDQYATAGVSNWTSSYSYSAPLVNLTNKDVMPNNAPQNSKGNNKVGGYYNFCAASAGSYCYDDNDGSPEGANATEDICPAGWRMPTGDTTGEYSALANAIYGSTGSTSDTTKVANFRTALSLPLSGRFYYGSASYQGDLGFFWSSTRYSNYDMYYLRILTDEVTPVDSNLRLYGYSVRCLAK